MRFILIILSLVFLLSCEKSVQFNLRSNEPLMVVDASIETGEAPRVVLSKSFQFFSSISARMIDMAFIKDAEVVISDGTVSRRLIRFDVPLGNGFGFSYYSTDPSAPGLGMLGEEGKAYTLSIRWKGKTYQAATTIPIPLKTMDSIWWVKAPATPDTSTRVVVRGRFTDPPRFGNYIRYFTKVNREPFYPGLNSVFDDQFVNGTSYVVDIDRGVNRNDSLNFDDYGFFRRGDTVTVKLSNIDKATYDFWRTVEFSYSSIGNPFASPVNIMGNISGGALGYFGGYANRFRSIIIPR